MEKISYLLCFLTNIYLIYQLRSGENKQKE